ncbi:aspartate 1-decarboxylase [Waterburya agarophytonicola K14]|uniref:Aspartate 1-decarboxylase n=1 Tax=Waterburya agarophytonicola KI4 TaxID=2874699 RepID=A0A964BWD6_9CYAN|nr:aspartate 1-decarboxylase [Waterburya agarophytonicola]MCC0178790.1 aspartate 1-decarboxylase [Waterburya agarophytonicola KI4]
MSQIKLMHAKLHRVTVTEANVNYVGSITIDQDLMDRVGILPLEEVDVINLDNGKRWSTYAIPGTPGEGGICPNGGAALLCKPRDLLIIIAYEYRDRTSVMQTGHQAKVIVADEHNHCREYLEQDLVPQGNSLKFKTFLADN